MVRVSKELESLVHQPWAAAVAALKQSEAAQQCLTLAVLHYWQVVLMPSQPALRRDLAIAIVATAGELVKDPKVAQLCDMETLPSLVVEFIALAVAQPESGFATRRFWPEQQGRVWLEEGATAPTMERAPAAEMRQLLPYAEWLEATAKGTAPKAGPGRPRGSGHWATPEEIKGTLYPVIRTLHRKGKKTSLQKVVEYGVNGLSARWVQKKISTVLGMDWPQVVAEALAEPD